MSQKVEYILSLKDLFTKTLSSAGNASGIFEKKVLNSFGKIGAGANAAANNSTNAFSRIGQAAVALAATIGVISFGKSIIEQGALFESYEIGLSTLLKSTKKGHEVFEQIKLDAANTPFDTDSMLMANRALISAGESAEKARLTILNLGNAISATGGSSDEMKRMAVNLNQIRSVGKAAAMDIKQFAFAGIPIYQLLSEATGKSVKETEDLVVSYDLLAFALDKAGRKGGMFEGGLEKMKKSTTGQISNLQESFAFLKVELFKSLKPAIDVTMIALSKLVAILSSKAPQMKAAVEKIVEVFTRLAPTIKNVMKDAWRYMKTFISILSAASAWVNRNRLIVKSLGVAIGIAGAAIILYNSIVKLGIFWTKLGIFWMNIQAGVLLVLEGGFTALWAIMSLNPIGLIITALALLAAGVYYAWNEFEGFRGTVMGLWEVLKTFAILVKDTLVGTFTGLGQIIDGVIHGSMKKIKEGSLAVGKGILAMGTGGMSLAVMNTNKLLGSFKKGYIGEIKTTEEKKKAKKTGDITDPAAEDNWSDKALGLFGGDLESKKKGKKGRKSHVDNSVDSIRSNRPSNITINIDSLIKSNTNQITNVKSEKDLQPFMDMLKQSLMTMLNDSQIITG